MGLAIKSSIAKAAAKKPLVSAKPSSSAGVKKAAQALNVKGFGNLPDPSSAKSSDELLMLVGKAWPQVSNVVGKETANWASAVLDHPKAGKMVTKAIATRLASKSLTAPVQESGLVSEVFKLVPELNLSPYQAPSAKKALGQKSDTRALGNNGKLGNFNAQQLMMRGAGAQEIASLNEVLKSLKKGEVPTALPLNAISRLPIPASGLAFQLDSSSIANQQVVIRKIEHPDKGPGVEIFFKMRDPESRATLREKMQSKGSQSGNIRLENRDATDERLVINESGADFKITPADVLEGEGFELALASETGPQAFGGMTRLRLFGDDEGLDTLAQSTVKDLGLSDALKPSTAESRETATKMRVLWQVDPAQASALGSSTFQNKAEVKALDAALAAKGVNPAELKGLKSKEVFPGHFTTVDPKQAEAYKELGVKYLFAGVKQASSVANILAGDGLMSTCERYGRGMILNGASSSADIKTGGADYVFTRMITEDAKDQSLSSSYASGDFQLVMNPDILGRKDWFAYEGDKYGNTKDDVFKNRKYGEELVSSMVNESYGRKAYCSNNEVMFQRGIATSSIDRVFAKSESARTQLLAELAAKNVTEIGGKPIEEAITVRTKTLD